MANFAVTPTDTTFSVQVGESTLAAAASATLSQAWAEGTLPGGAGTKSAKEHAQDAGGFADDAAQSAAYAGGFETPEYASQSAGNAATTPGQIFRVPIGTSPQTFNWFRRLSSGSEAVSPLATSGALAASGGAGLVGLIQSGTGAVATDALRKLREAPSVLDWMSASLRDTVVNRTAVDADRAGILTAINEAILARSVAGGGVLRVPAGYYLTNGNIRLRDGVYLVGEGYGTRIHNNATSGFAKCVIITGNMGDPANGNSLFDETGYDLNAIAAGDFTVTLVTAGDAANFSVGEIIGVESFEKWSGSWVSSPADDHGKLLNMNEIVAISGDTITLRYAVPDTYASSAGNRPTIKRLSGSINGYNGQPLFMAKNCGASNMRLTQSTGLSSGWYALFPCGINQTFERLWMDDCSTLIGSNNLGYSTFRDIEGRFEAAFLDFAEWQNGNLVENVHGTRFAANSAVNRIGLSCSNGTDNTFRNVTAFLDGRGGFSLTKVFRGKFENCRIVDSGSADDSNTQAILLGYGENCEAVDCEIINQHKIGIHITGEKHRVTQCRIPVTTTNVTESYAVYAPADVDVAYVHDNEFGIAGSEGVRDRFFQQTALQPGVRVYNNTGYVEGLGRRGAQNWAGFASTSQTGTPAVMRSVSLPGSTGVVRGYRIQAAGARGGTASTKTVNARLGSRIVGQVNYAAADTGTWSMDITINVRSSNNAAHVVGVARMGTTNSSTFQTIADGLVSDTTFTIEGLVANAADSVTVQTLVITPIIEQVNS